MQRNYNMGIVAAIFAGLSFGSIPVLSALLRDIGVSSAEQMFVRLFIGAIAGIIILGVLYTHENSNFFSSIELSVQITFILQGFLFVLMVIVYLSSITLKTPVGEAALLVQIHPLVTLFLGWLVLHEKISREKAISLILAISGLIVLLTPWEWESFLSSLTGDFLAAFNGILYAIYLLIGRWASPKRKNLSSSVSISWVLIWGLFWGIPLIILLNILPFPASVAKFSIQTFLSPNIILLGIIFALFGSIIPYGLIMVSNEWIESSKTSILLLGEPIAAIVLGLIFLGEPITIWYLIGGGGIIGAILILILYSSSENKIEKVNGA